MSQGDRRYRNLFLLLCAGCVLMTVLYGLMVVRRSRSSSATSPIVSTGPSQTPAEAPAAPPNEPASSGAKTDVATIAKGAPVAKAAPAGRLYFVTNAVGDTSHKLAVAPLDALDKVNYSAELSCERVDFSSGKGLCLAWDGTVSPPVKRTVQNSWMALMAKFTGYSAVLFDEQFRPGWSIKLKGLPNRVRLSPNGRLAGITVFISGESYASLQFSTRTTIVDIPSGEVLADLESFAVTRNGAVLQSPDFNFWGVTFTKDENRFYATLWTKRKAYIVECDLAKRTANVIYEGGECPSLSPDNKRVAFKKRFSGIGIITHWRICLLDLKTLTETPLGETRSVDDQVEWLDNDRILYALPQHQAPGTSTDIWMLPAAADGSPRLLLKDAFSPAVVPSGN
jgi:hypothetical protein